MTNTPEPSTRQRLEEATGMKWQLRKGQFLSDSVPHDVANIAALGRPIICLNDHLKSGHSPESAYPARARIFPISLNAPVEQQEKGVWLSIHPDDAIQICHDLENKPNARKVLAAIRDFIAAPTAGLAEDIRMSYREQPRRER